MKNLIYYSYNSDFKELFDLHIESLEKFNDGGFDCISLRLPPGATPFEASVNKLKIYREDLSGYENILYCDADTIWNKSPNDIFNAIKPGKINVVNEQQLMNHISGYWGEYLLTDEQKKSITENNVLGINTGVFAFKSNMISVFKDIEKFVYDNQDKHNGLYEQPFMNAYLYSHNLIEASLNDFVSNSYDGKGDKNLIHFLGGGKDDKLFKMKNYV